MNRASTGVLRLAVEREDFLAYTGLRSGEFLEFLESIYSPLNL
jgi:hypothetical protein